MVRRAAPIDSPAQHAHAVARLELSLLGGWTARAAGRALDLPTKKSQALLAYLGLRAGRPLEREALRALLWPESPKPQAQASLRQALLSLRKALPAQLQSALRADSGSVALDPARIWLDVSAVERDLAEDTPASLERAAALFQGPLLDGFTLGEAPFEEWVEMQRARLDTAMLGALERLAELQAREGRLDRALETALQALRLEPLQERAHRSVMRLYALQGRRAEALQHYEQCVTLLTRELGVEPDQETKQLRRELLGASNTASVAPPARPRAAPDTRRLGQAGECRTAWPLFGRANELEWLEQGLAAAAAGEGQLALLHGDAGIGKTRLLDALADRVRVRGGRCARGRCFESEQVLPFALWVDLLRGNGWLTDEQVLRGLPEAYRVELGRLLPALAPAGPAPMLFDARLLFEAVGALLAGAAARGTLLVLLDDLHWADGMSLRLLSFLVRRGAVDARICVVGSVRAEELANVPDLRALLHELAREQRLCERTLLPLEPPAALALLQALHPQADAGIDAHACEQILAISEGNPLVIVECARARLFGSLPQLPVPERVGALIGQHVDRLSPAAKDALASAAVIGRAFDFALLARATGAELRALALSVEELMQRRVLESTGSGLYFTHDRIREVLYASLSPARRQVLHGATARALEQLHAECLDEAAGTIGYHYARAGEPAASVAFLLRFARRCARNYGLEEALAALDEGQRQCRSLPQQLRDTRGLELAIRRCDCLMHMGRVPEVELTLAPFRDQVERLELPALTGPFHAWLALAKGFLGEGSAALEHSRRALAESERCADVRTAGLAHSVISLESSRSGQFERGIAHGQRAVAMLDPDTTDHEFAAFAHMHLGANYMSTGACRLASESFAHAHAIGERAHNVRLRSIALSFGGLSRVLAADFDAGLPACRMGLTLAPDPHSTWLSRLAVVRAYSLAAVVQRDTRLLQDQAYTACVTMLEASLGAADSPGMRAFTGRAMITLADAYLAQQEPQRARDMLQRAAQPLDSVEDPLATAAAQRVNGQIALALGDLDEAGARLGAARRSFESTGARLESALTGLAVSLVAWLRRDWQTAAQEVALAEETLLALELPRWLAIVRERSPARA